MCVINLCSTVLGGPVTDKRETAKNVARFAGEVAAEVAIGKVKDGLLVLNIIAGIILVPLFLILLFTQPVAAIFMLVVMLWGFKRKRDRRDARIKRFY
jgi:predicted RND superfamily exporter protein